MFNNFKIKVIIFILIILSLIVFISVFLQHNILSYEVNASIPIKYLNIPNTFVIKEPFCKVVELKVKGPKKLIDRFLEKNLKVNLDLSKITSGENNFSINRENLSLQKGVSILKITPSAILLDIEKRVEKLFPITPVYSGKPKLGFFVEKIRVSPEKILLKGPVNFFKSIDKLFIKSIDVTGSSESFKKEVVLDVDKNINASYSVEKIVAEVVIKEKNIRKYIKNITIYCNNNLYDYNINPPTVDIEIEGPYSLLEKLVIGKDIKVYIDIKGLKPGVYVRRSVISLPVYTRLIGAKPEIFTLTIKNK